jgi:hypothetical protein
MQLIQTRRPSAPLASCFAICLLLGFGAELEAKSATQDLGELARLRSANLLLERSIELAQHGDFCLVLDPAQLDLSLTLGGVALRHYPISSLQVGRARIAFLKRSVAPNWLGTIRPNGRLEPPKAEQRFEMQAPPLGSANVKAPPIPPRPEQAAAVPTDYFIVFDGGPALEIQSHGQIGWARTWAALKGAWNRWWRDKMAAVVGSPEAALRVRVVLDRSDAEALYRSLPPATKLLVLPTAVSVSPQVGPEEKKALPGGAPKPFFGTTQ